MFTRVSSRLAQSFVKDLYDGNIQGLHEAVVGIYTYLKGFSMKGMDPTRLGEISVGHAGTDNYVPPEQMTVEARNPQPGRLIHPVKCDAYPDGQAMHSDTEKWANQSSRGDMEQCAKPSSSRAKVKAAEPSVALVPFIGPDPPPQALRIEPESVDPKDGVKQHSRPTTKPTWNHPRQKYLQAKWKDREKN